MATAPPQQRNQPAAQDPTSKKLYKSGQDDVRAGNPEAALTARGALRLSA